MNEGLTLTEMMVQEATHTDIDWFLYLKNKPELLSTGRECKQIEQSHQH